MSVLPPSSPPLGTIPAVPVPKDRTGIYVAVVVGMAALAVLGIVALEVLRPAADNNPIIIQLIGFTTTTTGILVALLKGGENSTAIQDVHFSLNSRLTELLARTAEAKRAEGVVAGQGAAQGEPPDPAAVAAAARLVLYAAQFNAGAPAAATQIAGDAAAQAAAVATTTPPPPNTP